MKIQKLQQTFATIGHPETVVSNNGVVVSNNGVVVSNNGVVVSNNGVVVSNNGVVVSNNGVVVSNNGVVVSNNGVVVSNNDVVVASLEFDKFVKQNGIVHLKTAPYHPASNNLAECAVQIFKAVISKLQGESKLSPFLLIINTCTE